MTTDAGMRLATAPPKALRRAAEAAVRNDPDVSAVVLFGSRARGDHRPDSDWDLAFVTRGGAVRRKAPEGWKPPPGRMKIDCLQVPAEELRRKANALRHVACPIAREGRLLAGVWDRPEPGDAPRMEADEYAALLHGAVSRLDIAVGIAAAIPAVGGPRQDAADAAHHVAASADAAEYLAKAMLGRLGVDYRKTHSLDELAALFGDAHARLRDSVRALNGHSRAAARLAGVARLLVEEVDAAGSDGRFSGQMEEAARGIAATLAGRATELRAAGEPDPAPEDPLVAAVAASRPGLADVLETAAADIRVQGRRANA